MKICGITNLEDALLAVEAGADAVGFVFYEKSPRCVSLEAAREICSRLPERVEKVGVFVGASSTVGDVIAQAGLTLAQIYARAQSGLTDQFLMQLPCRVISAIPVGNLRENELCGFHVSDKTRERIFAALIDSGSSDRPGGTGERFDWRAMTDLVNRLDLKFVAAGGLTPNNVIEAIQILRPWGVDVASGVEARPGKKDPAKVRAFVNAVREIDRKAG
ncbi:MAG TPA: phosphoribosylanthranilate isomerase [Candidatus Binatia bacterium]|nr:phosphoribosylanthranilate isomerase [Candidatus Binatia bacterium]